jgi:hypothetical protein
VESPAQDGAGVGVGRPRTITDEAIEQVITKTLESTPGEDTHWSTRSMASAMGMSQSAVSRIWRAFGLKPHAIETWRLSTDPLFVDNVRDVVGLYMGSAGQRVGARGRREVPEAGDRPDRADPAHPAGCGP